jgi:hypothetical protein
MSTPHDKGGFCLANSASEVAGKSTFKGTSLRLPRLWMIDMLAGQRNRSTCDNRDAGLGAFVIGGRMNVTATGPTQASSSQEA